VRIIAGTRKGARIFAPKGHDTRPTSDRVREAAFNLIGPVDGAAVLDLYAGSGAMGLEALSRGAESAVLVESDRDACRAIQRNLAKLDLQGAEVVCRDVLRFLAAERRRFDLILVDPPYELVESLAVRLAVYLSPLLAENGLVALESSSRLEPQLEPLEVRTSRRYGGARVTLFSGVGSAEPPGSEGAGFAGAGAGEGRA
jgi:16S rRNA (guanine966-N2)-methyltransferase